MVGCALVIAWIPAGSSAALAARLASPFQAKPASPDPESEYSGAPTDDGRRIDTIEVDIRNGRYIVVEPILRDYLRKYSSSWRAHYDLGYVLFRTRGGKLSLAEVIRESIEELSRSLVLNINNADAHKILALDLVMIQRDSLAETEFKEAERLDPASAEIHYFLGRHYMGQSDYIPAQKELETAIQLDPAYMKAYENLGITMDMLGDRTAALTNYLKALELDERQNAISELPYLDLSKFYHDQNQIDLAESFALKALRINPRSDQSYFELARNYRERAEWNKAAEALTKAITINPRAAQYYFLLGQTYNRLGEREKSREALANYLKYRNLPELHSEFPEPQ
jgi:tetratricopeptide (TPR) repeat protein